MALSESEGGNTYLEFSLQKHKLNHWLIEAEFTYLFIIILKLMRKILANCKIKKSDPLPLLSCMS